MDKAPTHNFNLMLYSNTWHLSGTGNSCHPGFRYKAHWRHEYLEEECVCVWRRRKEGRKREGGGRREREYISPWVFWMATGKLVFQVPLIFQHSQHVSGNLFFLSKTAKSREWMNGWARICPYWFLSAPTYCSPHSPVTASGWWEQNLSDSPSANCFCYKCCNKVLLTKTLLFMAPQVLLQEKCQVLIQVSQTLGSAGAN